MTSLYRQGDILIVPVDTIPTDRRAADENGRLVLAHGEVTGHHHSFALADNVALFREDGSGAGLFLSVTGAPAALEHQEHSTIVVPPGRYAVVRQREYSPEAIRRVED